VTAARRDGEKMARLTAKLEEQFAEGAVFESAIKQNLVGRAQS